MIPLWLKVTYALFVSVRVPVYWDWVEYGPVNFLRAIPAAENLVKTLSEGEHSMTMIHHILTATDFSPRAAYAVRRRGKR